MKTFENILKELHAWIIWGLNFCLKDHHIEFGIVSMDLDPDEEKQIKAAIMKARAMNIVMQGKIERMAAGLRATTAGLDAVAIEQLINMLTNMILHGEKPNLEGLSEAEYQEVMAKVNAVRKDRCLYNKIKTQNRAEELAEEHTETHTESHAEMRVEY